MSIKAVLYAKKNLEFIAKESGFIPFIMEDKLYIEFAANGRNLRIADDEIIFQATEYLQNEIQLLTL